MQITAYSVVKFRKYKLSKAKGLAGELFLDLNQDIAMIRYF